MLFSAATQPHAWPRVNLANAVARLAIPIERMTHQRYWEDQERGGLYLAEVSYYDEYRVRDWLPSWAFVQEYLFGSGTGHHLPLGFVQFLDRDLLTNLQIVERMNEYLIAFDPIYKNVLMPISIWSLDELSNDDVGGIMPERDQVFCLHPENPGTFVNSVTLI